VFCQRINDEEKVFYNIVTRGEKWQHHQLKKICSVFHDRYFKSFVIQKTRSFLVTKVGTRLKNPKFWRMFFMIWEGGEMVESNQINYNW